MIFVCRQEVFAEFCWVMLLWGIKLIWMFLFSFGQNSCFELKQNPSFDGWKCSGFFFQMKETKRSEEEEDFRLTWMWWWWRILPGLPPASLLLLLLSGTEWRQTELTAEEASRGFWRQRKLLVSHNVTTPPEVVSISTATIAQGPSGQPATKRWREGVKECRRGNNTIVCFRPRGPNSDVNEAERFVRLMVLNNATMLL